MREYVQRKQASGNQIQSSASRQASAAEVLQNYKKKIVQMQTMNEEELLQGKFDATQREEIASNEKVNNTGLPDNLKSGIENLSGYSMDDVRVHYNSDKPAQLQALAYAQGTDIHIAPGQEQHLPHEAWHVVQQKQGRVQPTTQLQGINVNDNEGLEKEADVMGGKTLLQKKAEQFSRNVLPQQNAKNDIIQRTEKVGAFGKFKTVNFEAKKADVSIGVEMGSLKYTPNNKLDVQEGAEISLVQIVKEIKKETEVATEEASQGNIGFTMKEVKDGDFKGWALDADPIRKASKIGGDLNKIINQRGKVDGEVKGGDFGLTKKGNLFASTDFRYSQVRKEEDTPLYTGIKNRGETLPEKEHTGWSIIKDKKGWLPAYACIRDAPSAPINSNIIGMEFKTAALLNGVYYLDIVKWGWKYDTLTKNLQIVEIELDNQSGAAFTEVAKRWNSLMVDENPELVEKGGRNSNLMEMPAYKSFQP